MGKTWLSFNWLFSMWVDNMIVTCFMSDSQVENIIVTCENNMYLYIYIRLDANFHYYIIPDDIFPFFSVSCSTVTVTKCQAALRTLQGFPYFSPTCLCQEPHRDPECNQIREYLFDHPCGIVNTKGKNVFTCTQGLYECKLLKYR